MTKTIVKSFRYRIYPSKSQISTLENTLDLCRFLYNSALQERRDAYRLNKLSLNYKSQANQLTEIKQTNPEYKEVHSQVLQNVLKRVDLAFQSFFRRVKSKKGKAGFPRFQGNFRYNSFTFPQSGFRVENTKLVLSKIGKVKIKLHREIIGKIKTLTITRESTGKWFACFSVEATKEVLEPNNKSVGIDVGIKAFAVLSDGTEIANQKFFAQDEKRLAKAQRNLSKTPKRSRTRHRKRKIVAKIHAKIRNKRNNFAHQNSRELINKYQNIFFEKLNVQGMVKNHHLAKSIADAAWSQLINFTSYKAEEAGRTMKLINPNHTSTDCHQCGRRHKLTLNDRTFVCESCHINLDRDLNASLNILSRGLATLG